MHFPWLVLGVLGTAGIAGVTARATKQYALAAIAGGTLILYLHGWLYFHYTSDDAYISYRYARNLADGAGLVWNPGQHVEGYSNFSWVLTLAVAAKLGADIVLAGRWLGFVLAAISGALAYVLCTRLLEGTPGRAAGVIAALLLAACGTWAAWATAGLESPLFATLMLVAVLLHLREQRGDVLPVSGAVWAFVAMTRPDGMTLLLASGAFKVGESILRMRADGSDRESLERQFQQLVMWAAGFALLFLPYFAWRYHEYGWLYPNTYYAKVGEGIDQWERGLSYTSMFSQEYAAWLLLLAPLAVALTSIHRAASLYVLALVLAWFAYVVYVGGDSLARFRFFAPILPLMYVSIATSAAAITAALAEGRDRRIIEVTASAAVAGLLLFTLHASGADFGLPPERRAVGDRVEMGRWLHDNVPPSSVIAVIPAGAIPYESDLVTIDMLGLNDEHIAHRDLKLGLLGAGHEKYDSQYVLDRQPDIIILTDELSPGPWTRPDYAALNAGLIPARIDMLKQERLWSSYEPRSVNIGDGKWFNLLVRHEAIAVLATTQPASP